MSSPARLWLPLLFLLLCTGCSTPASIGAWQKRVEQYVAKEGHGDPSVLASVTLADGRPGFGMVGGFAPKGSIDGNALLLGQPVIAGRPMLIYLLAIIDNQEISDMRLIAVNFEPGGKARWHVGEDKSQATETFRSHKQSFWRSRFPERSEPPAGYLTFPGPEDSFDLNVQDSRAQATHRPSGAIWSVIVPGAS